MDKTIKSYDEFAKDLAKKFDAICPRIKDIDRIFSYIKKENPRVLELGCGNGRDAQEILKRTTNYLGIDGSKKLIKIAQKNLPKAKFRVDLFEELKLPNKSFDIMIDFASLMHLDKDKLAKFIHRLSKWLDNDGVLLLSMKEGEYAKFLSKGFGERVQYSYRPEDILLMTKNEFKLLELEKMNKNNQDWFTMFLRKI